MKRFMKPRQFEWAIVTYEGDQYDVCVGMEVEEVDEVRVVDSNVNITSVMDSGVIDWMLEKALEEIYHELH